MIAFVILAIMYVWQYGGRIRDDNTYRAEMASLFAYKKQLSELRSDPEYPTYTTNLVYMTQIANDHYIKKEILYSILDKRPKRARVYWFVTVNVTDEPYTAQYTTDTYGTDYMVNVQLYLGFRMEQQVNVFLRQIVNDMMREGELPTQPQKYTTIPDRQVGDWTFVLLHEELSPQTQIKGFQKTIIQARLWLQRVTVTPAQWFGLEYADTLDETVPLVLGKIPITKLTRLSRSQVDAQAEDEDD